MARGKTEGLSSPLPPLPSFWRTSMHAGWQLVVPTTSISESTHRRSTPRIPGEGVA